MSTNFQEKQLDPGLSSAVKYGLSDSSIKNWFKVDENKAVDQFYANSGGYIAQFYDVIIYGEAVNNALLSMGARAMGNNYGAHQGDDATSSLGANEKPKQDTYKSDSGTYYMEAEYKKWRQHHIFKDPKKGLFLSLKWGCSGVELPQPTFDIRQDFCIDTQKSISPPLLRGYTKENVVKLNITEARSMMWYHCFNAIFNQFFSWPLIKPKDSLKKLSIVVIPKGNYLSDINGRNGDTGKSETSIPINQAHRLMASQVFEFNSAVPDSMSPMSWKSKVDGKMEFEVKFRVPHPFNESFKNDMDNMTLSTNPNDYTPAFVPIFPA